MVLVPAIEYSSMEKVPKRGKNRQYKLKHKELPVTYTPDFVGED